MKKILAFIGSPRKKGHTNFMLDQVLKGAKKAGAQVEKIDLTELNIAPCIECYSCQMSSAYRCVVEDDMQKLYDKLEAADELIFASPIFWFGPTAQTKPFLDRTFALIKSDPDKLVFTSPLTGKGFSLVTTCAGGPFDGADILVDSIRRAAMMLAMIYRGTVLAHSVRSLEQLENDTALIKQAQQFGEEIAKS